MTKSKLFLFILSIGVSNALFAQKYKKIIYRQTSFENAECAITAEDPVSTEKYIKVKLRIKNKTSDYVVFDASKCIFYINGKEFNTTEKLLLIRPNADDYRVIDLKGSGYLVENFEMKIDGLSRFSADSKGISVPSFQLPPSSNDFSAGGFKVNMVRLFKETQRTDVKFRAIYNGNKIGVFEPSKVSVKMPDGKEFANYHSDRSPLIFVPGDEDTFTTTWLNDVMIGSGDMQTAEMKILWGDAFKEVSTNPITPMKLDFKIEPSLSK